MKSNANFIVFLFYDIHNTYEISTCPNKARGRQTRKIFKPDVKGRKIVRNYFPGNEKSTKTFINRANTTAKGRLLQVLFDMETRLK